MKKRFIYGTLIALMIPLFSSSQIVEKYPDKTPEKLDLYLVIGQSNMAGRASIEPKDEAAIEGAYVFSGDIDNPWSMATNPLNRHSTHSQKDEYATIESCLFFCKKNQGSAPIE